MLIFSKVVISQESKDLTDLLRHMYTESGEVNLFADADIQVLAQVESTNDYALSNCKHNKGLYIAWHQTKGRGRYGNQWDTNTGNIAMSLAWRMSSQFLDGLSLACGVALAQVLDTYHIHCSLKWPNDVLVGNKKLAGILVELQQDANNHADSLRWLVVIGIGINVAIHPTSATSLTKVLPIHQNQHFNKLTFCAVLAKQLAKVLNGFHVEGFAPWHQLWCYYDHWLGKQVQVHYQGEKFIGIHAGIDQRGRLRLMRDGTMQCITSAAVQLRLASEI